MTPPCHEHVPGGLRAVGVPGWELRCGWPERCAEENRCFWARFHELEGQPDAEGRDEQQDFGW